MSSALVLSPNEAQLTRNTFGTKRPAHDTFLAGYRAPPLMRDIASFLKKEKGVTWLLAPVDGRGRACVGRSLWWQCDRMVPEEAIVWSNNTYNLVLTMLTDGLRLRFREIQAKLP